MLPVDGGMWAAAGRLNARALEVAQHLIIAGALAEHVESMEADLVKAVGVLRGLNLIGAKHLGDVAACDWLPQPATAELFGLGVAADDFYEPGCTWRRW